MNSTHSPFVCGVRPNTIPAGFEMYRRARVNTFRAVVSIPWGVLAVLLLCVCAPERAFAAMVFAPLCNDDASSAIADDPVVGGRVDEVDGLPCAPQWAEGGVGLARPAEPERPICGSGWAHSAWLSVTEHVWSVPDAASVGIEWVPAPSGPQQGLADSIFRPPKA